MSKRLQNIFLRSAKHSPWTFQISMNNLEFRSVLKFFHLEPRCVEGIAKLSVPVEIEVTDKIRLRGSYNKTEQKFAIELRYINEVLV